MDQPINNSLVGGQDIDQIGNDSSDDDQSVLLSDRDQFTDDLSSSGSQSQQTNSITSVADNNYTQLNNQNAQGITDSSFDATADNGSLDSKQTPSAGPFPPPSPIQPGTKLHQKMWQASLNAGKGTLTTILDFFRTCYYKKSDDVIATQVGLVVNEDKDEYLKNEAFKEARIKEDNIQRDKIRADFMRHLGVPKVVIIAFLLLVSIVYQVMYANKGGPVDPTTGTATTKPTSYPPKTMLNYSAYRMRAFGTAIVTGSCGAISICALYIMRRSKLGLPLVGNMILVFSILFLFDLSQEASGLNKFLDRDETQKGNSVYYNMAVDQGEPVNLISEEIADDGKGDPFFLSMVYVLIIIIVIVLTVIGIRLIKLAACGARLNAPDLSIMCRISMNNRKKYLWILFIVEIIIVCMINFIPIIVAPIIRKDTIKYGPSTWAMMIVIVILQLMFQFAGVTPKAEHIVDCLPPMRGNYEEGNITKDEPNQTSAAITKAETNQTSAAITMATP